jgi:predicted flap endonuclease-1-like 5' DNA nuclease
LGTWHGICLGMRTTERVSEEMKLPKFVAGLLIGTAIGLIIWYWQKSTSAEDGALAVLDRLASAEARVRDLESRLRLAQEKHSISKQPEVLSGLADLWGLAAGPEEAQESSPEEEAPPALIENDLKVISGIGPTYERRLKEANVRTFADLAQQTPGNLREIVGIKTWHAADPQQWIAEAQTLSEASTKKS